jgi:arylsulfatase A-like enzyme
MPAHLWNNGKETTRFYENYDERMRRYLMNTMDRQLEEDYFCARTFRSALAWLERNRSNGPLFLLADTFDPHEPWDAPPRFQRMYYDKYPYERTLFGYGIDIRDIRPEDHEMIRGLYAAEVSFVDMWVGRFLSGLEELGLKENTVVAFTSDHGTHLGEEGLFQKQSSLLTSCITRVPLIVRHPGIEAQKIDSLVSFTDLMPSFLDMLKVKNPPEMDGKSLVPLMQGQVPALHDTLVSEFPRFAAVRTPDWYYFQHVAGKDRGHGPCLYDVKKDPRETANVMGQHPDVAARLRGFLESRMERSIPAV